VHGHPEGQVMAVAFEIAGMKFTALNGGPLFTFNESISIQIFCEGQAEVDYLWERLSEGGEPGHCGWLKDKFGLSWQVIPQSLIDYLGDPDPQKAMRVTNAF